MKKLNQSRPIRKTTLAEQVADTLKEAIVDGTLQAGEALPTEPELATQFGVSRAVVRDATRMLAARGLVEAQHGRGVFVTESQSEAFGDALLLALRRMEATVWDVEQFEQMVMPTVCSLAAQMATEEDIAALRAAIDHYLAAMERNLQAETTQSQREQQIQLYRAIVQTIYAATHNRVWELLVQPLMRLRSLRRWVSAETTPTTILAGETAYLEALFAAIISRDPALAYSQVADLIRLPVEAETAMRATPIGEIANIPLPFPPPR